MHSWHAELTQHQIHHHEDVLGVLEREPQVHEERVLQGAQQFLLAKHVLHGVFRDDLDLVHVFHGVHLLRVFLLHNAYLQRTYINKQRVQMAVTGSIEQN